MNTKKANSKAIIGGLSAARVAAAAHAQNHQIGHGPVSVAPVQQSALEVQLLRQRELLEDLLSAANELVDPLHVVLTHDPRNMEGDNSKDAPEPIHSCPLESVVRQTNTQIYVAVAALRNLRSAIAL